MEHDDDVAALRREVSEGKRGRRYNQELIPRVLACVERRRKQGATLAQAVSELGLKVDVVCRWKRTAGGGKKAKRRSKQAASPSKPERAKAKAVRMRPVQVVDADTGRNVSIVTPAGFRIEGLTLEQARSMLLALR